MHVKLCHSVTVQLHYVKCRPGVGRMAVWGTVHPDAGQTRPMGDGTTEGERMAALLGLEPLPDEGGLFRRTHIDAYSSAIYYLLMAPDFSALHRLGATETYHWYAGAPLRLLLLGADGRAGEVVLGPDIPAGQRPQVVVPAGTWQGSSPAAEWSLVGTT